MKINERTRLLVYFKKSKRNERMKGRVYGKRKIKGKGGVDEREEIIAVDKIQIVRHFPTEIVILITERGPFTSYLFISNLFHKSSFIWL